VARQMLLEFVCIARAFLIAAKIVLEKISLCIKFCLNLFASRALFSSQQN
jgi:hypothetical protein